MRIEISQIPTERSKKGTFLAWKMEKCPQFISLAVNDVISILVLGFDSLKILLHEDLCRSFQEKGPCGDVLDVE